MNRYLNKTVHITFEIHRTDHDHMKEIIKHITILLDALNVSAKIITIKEVSKESV